MLCIAELASTASATSTLNGMAVWMLFVTLLFSTLRYDIPTMSCTSGKATPQNANSNNNNRRHTNRKGRKKYITTKKKCCLVLNKLKSFFLCMSLLLSARLSLCVSPYFFSRLRLNFNIQTVACPATTAPSTAATNAECRQQQKKVCVPFFFVLPLLSMMPHMIHTNGAPIRRCGHCATFIASKPMPRTIDDGLCARDKSLLRHNSLSHSHTVCRRCKKP